MKLEDPEVGNEVQGMQADLASSLGPWFAGLTLGERWTSGTLEIVPVIAPVDGTVRHRLLHEAVAEKEIEVVEHPGAAQVQEVVAINHGKIPVLILEGDLLMGAKQNRMVVRTVLVAAEAKAAVHVGCVERGRWERGPVVFGAAEMSAHSDLRRATLRATSVAKTRTGTPVADQQQVWHDVDAVMHQEGYRSATSDMLSAYRAYRERKQASWPAPSAGQVGVLAFANGRLLGMELLGHAGMWSAVAERKLASFEFTAAMERARTAGEPDVRGVPAPEWMERIRRLPVTALPSEGLGLDVTLTGEDLAGAGLVDGGAPAHLAVFRS